MPYAVHFNAGLVPEAKALDRDALEAEALKATLLLGLREDYQGADAERAELAIVEQVNFQVLGSRGQALQSENRGGRSWSYRGGSRLSPDAVMLCRSISDWTDPRYMGFEPVGSLR